MHACMAWRARDGARAPAAACSGPAAAAEQAGPCTVPASPPPVGLPGCPRSGDVLGGEWSISDGRSLTRFADGVVLLAKGQQHAGRGRQLLQAFNNPNHAQQLAAAAASNAAATAAGILPFTGGRATCVKRGQVPRARGMPAGRRQPLAKPVVLGAAGLR